MRLRRWMAPLAMLLCVAPWSAGASTTRPISFEMLYDGYRFACGTLPSDEVRAIGTPTELAAFVDAHGERAQPPMALPAVDFDTHRVLAYAIEGTGFPETSFERMEATATPVGDVVVADLSWRSRHELVCVTGIGLARIARTAGIAAFRDADSGWVYGADRLD